MGEQQSGEPRGAQRLESDMREFLSIENFPFLNNSDILPGIDVDYQQGREDWIDYYQRDDNKGRARSNSVNVAMPSTFDKPPPAAPFQLAAKVANNSDLDIFTRPNAYDAEEREIFPDMKRIRRETSAASPNLLERRRRDLHLQIDTEETIRVRKNPVGYPPPQGRTHKMAPFLPTTPTRQHISPYAHTGRGSGHRRFNGTVDPRLQVGSVSYQQPSIQFAKSSRDGFNGVSSMQRNWHNQYRVRNGSGLSQQERELREHSMRIASLQEKRLEPRGTMNPIDMDMRTAQRGQRIEVSSHGQVPAADQGSHRSRAGT